MGGRKIMAAATLIAAVATATVSCPSAAQPKFEDALGPIQMRHLDNGRTTVYR